MLLWAFIDPKCVICSPSLGLCTGETLARGLLLPRPALLANCHSSSQLQQDDSDLPGRPSGTPAPTTVDQPRPPPVPTWRPACKEPVCTPVCVCVRARAHTWATGMWVGFTCELQGVRKKKPSLAQCLAQGSSSSFILKNVLDHRLGRRLVPCGI